MKISLTGVGTATHTGSVRDSYGHALLPIQAQGNGTTTFRVRGRISPDAPWYDIVTAGTADFLQSISWVPFIQLEITAGTGTVTLWVGEE
jgi:hypothetical protein